MYNVGGMSVQPLQPCVILNEICNIVQITFKGALYFPQVHFG